MFYNLLGYHPCCNEQLVPRELAILLHLHLQIFWLIKRYLEVFSEELWDLSGLSGGICSLYHGLHLCLGEFTLSLLDSRRLLMRDP